MDTNTLLLTGLLGLAAGLVVGLLLGRSLNPREQQRKDTEKQLNEAQNQLKDYQHEVTEHFAKTAKLFNDLSHSYRDVHEQLSSSAMLLTNPETSRKMVDAGFGQLKDGALPITELPAPPKDYAPKVPGGILSEEYGLRDERPSFEGRHLKVANDVAKEITDEDDPTLKVS
ncbi:Z-ring associated ZapG family protein [Porticoccus sp.]